MSSFRYRERQLAVTYVENESTPLYEDVRMLDDAAHAPRVDAEHIVQQSLIGLKLKANELEARRLQEIVVAFGCGLLTFVVGLLVQRVRSSSEGRYHAASLELESGIELGED